MQERVTEGSGEGFEGPVQGWFGEETQDSYPSPTCCLPAFCEVLPFKMMDIQTCSSPLSTPRSCHANLLS